MISRQLFKRNLFRFSCIENAIVGYNDQMNGVDS